MNKKNIVALITILTMLLATSGTNFAFADNGNVGYKLDTLIEVENCSHSGMTTRKVNSPYASGGVYVVNTGSDIAAPGDIMTDDVSLMVDVAATNKTRVFVRVLFPSGSGTAFYWRWDNSSWNTFTGTSSVKFQWVELTTDDLPKGLHKFSLCRQKSGITFDSIIITQNPDFVPTEPEGVEMIPEVERTISHTQSYIPSYSGNGFVFEAEDMTYDTDFVGVGDKDASGTAGIKAMVGDREVPNAVEAGNAEFEFTSEENGNVAIWLRINTPTSSSDSGFTAVEGEKYVIQNFSAQKDFYWTMVVQSLKVEKGGKYKFKYQHRESGMILDQFVVTGVPAYIPEGILKEIVVESTDLPQKYELPPVNPPAGEHPRVYFRASDREELIYKLNHPENAVLKKTFDQYVSDKIDIGSGFNQTAYLKIEAKAYHYALFGDKKIGREAVDAALKTISGWPPLVGNIEGNTRNNGRLITMHSLVYDWCYDLLTEEEKKKIIDLCAATASLMENGWPPDKQPAIVGHGAEAQLLRDIMVFAIATYDERPDIWNFVGGRYYQEFVPVRRWYMPAGIHHQGGNYGVYRHLWDLHAYKLITGMGGPEPYPAKDVAGMDYSRLIYLRRPDGMVTLDGDMYDTDPMTYETMSQTNLLLSSSIAMDPYLKDEYVRVTYDSTKAAISRPYGSAQDSGLVLHLMFSEPDLERKSRENLPLSAFYGSPMGTMAARTGWGDGVTDDSVVAQLKMDEYWFANHQTPAAGHFALYYKGPLTGQGGVYDIYNSPAFKHYNHHTTAANCILVYDPNEPASNFDGEGNDGGQLRHLNTSAKSFEDLLTNPVLKKNTVEGHEIDPKDIMNPDYTYLKGDLTNAYSDKITDYTRSLMFLNLKDDKIPAALVVFDKVSVKNPDFKKTWLLHGQSYPRFDKNRTVWLSSPYENKLGEKFTGKMINDSLLPADDKVTKTVVGSEEDGWNIVNGVNVLGNTNNTKLAEENTYRLEIATKEPKETEYFLNVLQVTDEGNNVYHSAKLLESELFYGTTISDRAVFFSKSGDRIGGTVTLRVPTGTNYKYTVCDLESGVWEVTSSQGTQSVTVTEEGGVLAFDAPAGDLTLVKTDAEAEKLETKELVLGDKKTLYIKCNGEFVHQPVEAELKDDRYVISIDELAVKMGLKASKEFMKNIYVDESQKITVEIRHGSGVMYVNGKEVKLTVPTYFKDGHLMVEVRAFAEVFNYKVFYDTIQDMVFLTENPQFARMELPEGYAEIKAVTGNHGVQDTLTLSSANVNDGLLTTQWAASGTDTFFDIEFTKEVMLENVEIVFAPNNRRTAFFDIQISSDGVNYETIYSGTGSADGDGETFEVFTFDRNKEYKTKYVRYLGKASNISEWNGVREMRFKMAEPIIRWEEKAEYASVANITSDGDAVAELNRWDNVNDNNSRTIWAAQGKGRYIQFELLEITSLKGVNVMFNPNSNRIPSFEIHVSTDGVNFESVYAGTGNPASEAFTWEEFDFGKTVSAKFVRYVGMGSNISAWNGVNEIRFIKE